jgi:triacylglycerol lipase
MGLGWTIAFVMSLFAAWHFFLILRLKKHWSLLWQYDAEDGGEQTLEPREVGRLALPINGELDREVAVYLGDFLRRTQVAYRSKGEKPFPVRTGTTVVKEIRLSGEVACSIVKSEQSLVVGFRGSTTAENWATNLDFALDPIATTSSEPFELRTTTTSFSGSDGHREDYPMVHGGYDDWYARMGGAVREAVIEQKDTTAIYLTGHSMGGAIAALCMFDLIDRNLVGPDKLCAVTFGSPRVGNETFAKILKNAALYQIHNTADIVPSAPFSSSPSLCGKSTIFHYVHAGQGLLFHENGNSLMGAHGLGTSQRVLEDKNRSLTSFREF